MKKTIDNEYEIILFFESLKGQEITEEETLQFKKELTEVIFKPRSKKKRNAFCKTMDVGFFNTVVISLGLPYRIRKISNESGVCYMIKDKGDK